MEKHYTLITGASMGIGRALAEECAQRGRNCITSSIGWPGIACCGQRNCAKARGLETHPFGIDLTATDAPLKVYTWCQENGYSVDMLINNAGFGKGRCAGKGSIGSVPIDAAAQQPGDV